MTVSLIWAQAANGVVGRDGTLPWHLPEDLAHFRALTSGATVVMGRRTWDSLPPRFRPLPGRRNVVLTRDPSWSADGAEVAHDITAALAARTDGDADVWVIGGAGVWAAALPLAHVVEVTDLRAEFAGDVHAPDLDLVWRLESSDPEDGWHRSSTGLEYRWRRLARVRSGAIR